jgi:hypothetical protein
MFSRRAIKLISASRASYACSHRVRCLLTRGIWGNARVRCPNPVYYTHDDEAVIHCESEEDTHNLGYDFAEVLLSNHHVL